MDQLRPPAILTAVKKIMVLIGYGDCPYTLAKIKIPVTAGK
jgi:hypothetical protein